jgi:hypothetical protein
MAAYFPEKAVAVLRAARFDPSATPSLELLSGAFIWSDERYLEFVAYCSHDGVLTYWEPVIYRSSLILGRPDAESRSGWKELRQACPNWPGFRAERSSESLRKDLERALSEEDPPEMGSRTGGFLRDVLRRLGLAPA